MIITNLTGKRIYDSRNFFTIQCTLTLDNQTTITASCPGGISTSKYEDGSQSLTEALYHLEHTIAPALQGKTPHLVHCDTLLQNLAQQYNLGIQALLPVSIALVRAHAHNEQRELFSLLQEIASFPSPSRPSLFFNVLHGGKHATNNLYLQEILAAPRCKTLHESLLAGQAIQQALITLFEQKKLATDHTNIPCWHEPKKGKKLLDEKEAFDLVCQATEIAGFRAGIDVTFGIDMAASQFYDEEKALYHFHNNLLSAANMINYYKQLSKQYPITFIEDGLAQDDETGWQDLLKAFCNKAYIVGEDLFASNANRIKQGIEKKLANGVIIKPGQTKTVSQLLTAIKACHTVGCTIVTSPRSRETPDTFVADLTIASSASFYKTVACCCPYHMEKNYRLCNIEKKMRLSLKQKARLRRNPCNRI